MFDGVIEFTSTQYRDSAEFMRKVQALVGGVARDYEPARLCVIRVDNWFGPKWMHFAGKVSVGKHFCAGIHKRILHVPPFVPHRVIAERVFAGPDYDATIPRPPCISSAQARWHLQGESRTWIRRLHSYGSAVSPRYRSGVQSWFMYQLLLHRRRTTDAKAAGQKHSTWACRNTN